MLRAALIALACAALAGCGSEPSSSTATATAAKGPKKPDRFDREKAWDLIVEQVEVGQRPAGSPQLRKLAVRLRDAMPDGRFEKLPGEPGLRNVVSTVKGKKPALVIGAHYDTLVKPEGFVGANNGAAGSAIVVQLAREAARRKRGENARELRFVLFDGEEPAEGLPEEQTDFYNTGLRGSRAYVEKHGDRVGAMVLLDYVAGKGLRLPREASSTADLWNKVRASARRMGVLSTFPDDTGPGITDDHTPFLREGIPAVDLIDWTYPGHSLEDGLDLLSKRSVDIVGETISDLIVRW